MLTKVKKSEYHIDFVKLEPIGKSPLGSFSKLKNIQYGIITLHAKHNKRNGPKNKTFICGLHYRCWIAESTPEVLCIFIANNIGDSEYKELYAASEETIKECCASVL